ncbi:MAG TPA: aldehyde ferredoxin oxidoreductase family protein [Isosphaeraceae bacterium]|nr:aldehyde ferredoxin oxidoreductase family protein [Isosphaeraceae bacterium]
MASLCGYHGRYLRIDLSNRRAGLVSLAEPVLRSFLGGAGLGTWVLAHEVAAGTDPLAAESGLVFALSPLVGSPLTTSAKFAVVGLSPLTGRISDALSSSHFAIAAKRTGVDALVLTGASEVPTVVFVDGQGSDEPVVRFEAANDLWGTPASEAEASLRAKYGAEWQVAAIGPAGEALVPFATISHDGRHAGRGGLGAVLGSKHVKAIAVRGDQRVALYDPQSTVALARRLSARSFGPATEKYRELGTVANLLVFNRFDALPTRNFQAGRFEGAEPLSFEAIAPARRVARKSCAACTIGCEHIYALDSGSKVRLEYESVYALGPLCGVSDPEQVMRAAQACDQAGLDTISMGGTIALLMECGERGMIDARVGAAGRTLRFGDGESVLEAIAATVRGEGLGSLLALGSRRAAEAIGGEAPALAAHVKGLELPGYDPRALHTMALGLAVATRGADHNRSGAYEADFSNRVDRQSGGPDSARWAAELEDRAALVDSMILCKFLRHVFEDLFEESAEMLANVTGWDFNASELRTIARRVVNARKCVNQREGWTRAEDTLPPRLLSEGPATPGASFLTRERLDAMIAAYYAERGWTPDGRVPVALRQQLGLDKAEFGAP